MPEFLLSVFLSLSTMVAAPIRGHPIWRQTQLERESEEATKKITGTIVTVGNGGQSFATEVSSGDANETMQFVVDNSTRLVGELKVGASVSVEYQPMEDGRNLAVNITAQG